MKTFSPFYCGKAAFVVGNIFTVCMCKADPRKTLCYHRCTKSRTISRVLHENILEWANAQAALDQVLRSLAANPRFRLPCIKYNDIISHTVQTFADNSWHFHICSRLSTTTD